MVDSPGSVLRCRHLTVPAEPVRSWRPRRSGPGVPLLLNLDLELRPADRIWLIGALDPGVDALLGAIRGERPATGSLRVSGDELIGASRRTRARAMTAIQVWGSDPEVLPPARSANDVVVSAVQATRRRKATKGSTEPVPAAEAVATALLEELGLSGSDHARPLGELPDHDAWRVRFALAISREPRLLVTVGSLPAPAHVAGAQAVIERIHHAGAAVLHLDDRLPYVVGPDEAVAVVCGGRVVEVLDDSSVADPMHPFARSLSDAGAGDDQVLAAVGCPFRSGCERAQECCAVMPALAVPLGGQHRVACHFPLAGMLASGTPASSEPTAREFAQGW